MILVCLICFNHTSVFAKESGMRNANISQPQLSDKNPEKSITVKRKGGWKKKLKRTSSKAKNVAKSAADKAKEAAKKAAKAAAAEAERLAEEARKAAELAEKLANDSVNSIKNIVGDIADVPADVANALKDVAKGVENLSQESLDALKKFGDQLGELSDEAFAELEAQARAAGDLAAGMWDALMDTFIDIYEEPMSEEDYISGLDFTNGDVSSSNMGIKTNSENNGFVNDMAAEEEDIEVEEFKPPERRQLGFSVAQQYNLSLKPPPGDVSIVFLGNIFGSVDGALAGSGGQIIGAMFGVFNAAVLAFGGIVLLYSLIVSTGNTAHEGQFIGQKWSSIWVPLRSFVGVGAIIPVSSGYCLMQIFVMTVVVQGVGAADSVWNAALSYLSRGGLIVQQQIRPSSSVAADDGKILSAAMGIQAAQICMITMENKFKQYHETDLREASLATGHCNPDLLTAGSAWEYYCNNPVPSFNGSVDILNDKNTCPTDQSDACELIQLMPNFPTENDTNIYASLNGLCGQIKWTSYRPSNGDDSSLTDKDQFIIHNSRTIAIHQMYLALLTASSRMVNNTKYFNKDIDCGKERCSEDGVSKLDFGYPLTLTYKTNCLGRNESGVTYDSDNACVAWGTPTQIGGMLIGTELQDAVAAYNGIMLPTLSANKMNSSNYEKQYRKARDFIDRAKNQGWILSGAYFFKLALLNDYVDGSAGSDTTDTGSNLIVKSQSDRTWAFKDIKSALLTPETDCADSYDGLTMLKPFCQLKQDDVDQMGFVLGGVNYRKAALPDSSTFKSTANRDWYQTRANNAYAYMINGNTMVLPSQSTILNAGLKDMGFNDFNPTTNVPQLSNISISGGKWGLAGAGIKLLYNGIGKPLWNAIMDIMLPFAIMMMSLALSPIVNMVGTIFNNALEVMRVGGVNPIIAMANMGTAFIDGVGNSWVSLLMFASIYGMLPAGQGILQSMMPVVTAWMGIMLGVGFTAAFYVPFVPFLVFTFGAIGWIIGVIESMVAAPIVALALIVPEGHDSFGKSEPAYMLLLNVFLRPSMMVIGYICGIILSYVGVWVMNEGFNYAMNDIKLLPPISKDNMGAYLASSPDKSHYGFWSNIFLLYFAVLTYVSTYEAIVIKSFDLIHHMPDKVLRWIAGGNQEQLGSGTVEPMIQEVKAQTDKAAKQASGAMAKVNSTLSKTDQDVKTLKSQAKEGLEKLKSQGKQGK